jgi:hypothetical protein
LPGESAAPTGRFSGADRGPSRMPGPTPRGDALRCDHAARGFPYRPAGGDDQRRGVGRRGRRHRRAPGGRTRAVASPARDGADLVGCGRSGHPHDGAARCGEHTGERRDVVRPRRPDRGAGGRRGADLGSIARRVARGHARLHARAWLADAPGTSGVVRAPAAGGSGSAGRAGGRAGCAAVRRPRRRVAFAGDAGYVGRRRRPGCRTGQRGPIRSTAHAHPPPTKCGRPAAALRSVYDLSRGRTLHPSRRRRTRPIHRG